LSEIEEIFKKNVKTASKKLWAKKRFFKKQIGGYRGYKFPRCYGSVNW